MAEVGEAVSDVRVGDRVGVHYFHACRRVRRAGGRPASSLVPVSADLDVAEAASLCCSGTTALHATTVAEVRDGQTAVVYGVGGVGLALVQVLRMAGAG